MLEKNNKAFASSNDILVTNNTLFHKKKKTNDKAS